MSGRDLYVPLNRLIVDKETSWSFADINLTPVEIAKQGIIMWCCNNLECKWTMRGGSKFGFESVADAAMFKIQFGF